MKLFDEKIECCGCMACADMCPKQAISVKNDSHGFAYPFVQSDLCVNCGLCGKVCAFKHGQPVVAYDKKCYAVKNRSNETRMKSSSGGMYTALTDYVLEQHGVVYGAAYVSKDKVAHIRCETEEVRDRTRSAKYVQSDMRGIYLQVKNDLQQGKLVLFSGTPCQVAEARKVFQDYRGRLILVDLICHGVPSPMIFREHIRYCEEKTGKTVAEYQFRPKVGDGRNKRPAVKYTDGTVDAKSPYIDLYFQMFNENKNLRESCFDCPYSSQNRPGDITIGDFWGIKNLMPDFEDGYGISAVIVNSEQGAKVFQEIQSGLEVCESTYEDIAKRNPNLKRPSARPKRRTFWLKYRFLGWNRIVDGYQKNGLLKQIKKLI